MYDEKKIEDSLEFCKDIKIYFEEDTNLKKVHYSEYKAGDLVEGNHLKEPILDHTADGIIQKGEIIRRTIRQDFSFLLLSFVLALGISLLFIRYVAHHNIVEGNSMETTLHNRDHLIVEKISYYFHEPERFDIIVFPFNKEVNFIKRIIGLPGEVVQVKEGEVYINSEKLDDSYGNAIMEDPGIAKYEITLGDDEYFVLGDNRNFSNDSRKEIVGTIKREDIIGRAWVRFYPLDTIGVIGP